MSIKLTASEVLTLELADAGFWFKREHYFARPRLWRFDFALPAHKLALEIEGGIFGGKKCPVCKQRRGGRHNSGIGFKKDLEKYNAATVRGWRVLRFMPEEVTAGQALRTVLECIG